MSNDSTTSSNLADILQALGWIDDSDVTREDLQAAFDRLDRRLASGACLPELSHLRAAISAHLDGDAERARAELVRWDPSLARSAYEIPAGDIRPLGAAAKPYGGAR